MATDFDRAISRGGAAALMPEEVVDSMLGKAVEQSAVLSLFKRIPVSRAQVRFPVLSVLPHAYWVSGDTGLKKSSRVAWDNKYLNIEEIAVIVPIPENVLDDADYDIWAQVETLIAEEIGRTLDAAVFFGDGAPASFPDDIQQAATSAGNTNAEGNDAANGSFMGDFDDTLATLEADGYDMTGVVASRTWKASLRAARSSTGEQLDRDRVNPALDEIDGVPIMYSMRGLWPGDVRLFVGDFANEFVIGVRKDITVKVLDQAVISDESGNVILNLPQQDSVAVRVTFRAGWQVANRINNDRKVEANRYPAAIQTKSS